METYTFEVCLTVQVEAFSESDAYDLLHDHFDTGEDAGVVIVDAEFKKQ